MKLKLCVRLITFVVMGFAPLACVSNETRGRGRGPDQVAPARAERAPSELPTNEVAGEKPLASSTPTTFTGCDGVRPINRKLRSQILNDVVQKARKEIAMGRATPKDSVTYDRVATFAAAAIDDSVPFVSLDRTCWSDFYEARKFLEDKKEAEAKDAAAEWTSCLAATFPNRVPIAAPYLSCFDASADTR